VISGHLLTRYRGRFAGDQDDHDLTQVLDLAVEDPGGRWRASLSARANLDLDGHDPAGDGLFYDLHDTYDGALQAQLFHAYLDLASERLSLVRLGRQPLYDTPVVVLFDGLRVEKRLDGEPGVRVGAYGGAGEHAYESSGSGDLVLGAFGALAPWQDAELRADWMHLDDERLGAQHRNDLLGLLLAQDLPGSTRFSRIETRFTSLDGNGRDLSLAASHADAERHFSVQGSVYRLLQTQRALAAPLDPFHDTLFDLFPYYQLELSATKDWRHFALLGGADVRRVAERADVGEFNRDFERWFLTGTLPDVLDCTLTLTGEVWNADDSDYDTWGAGLARELQPDWSVSLGSYYSLYKYDLFSSEERDHVRTYYLDLRWKPVRERRWSLRYEHEQNDIEDFDQLRLDYAWSF